MTDSIVHSSAPVTVVGGGQATQKDLQEALTLAPLCVAADGGAGLAVQAGVPLSAVIGDLDSISPDVEARVDPKTLHRSTDQNTTDFDKVLDAVSAPVLIGVGFTGGRIDHQLAACHSLLRRADRPCVLIGATELIFLMPREIVLPCTRGECISLFPLTKVTGWSNGLKWEIEGLAFAPGGQIGTSNAAMGPVHLKMDQPGMLAMVPRRLIQQVVHQLAAAVGGRWPARAAPHRDPTP